MEDVKVHLQNGVDVNESDRVSNYIYTYFTLLNCLIICIVAVCVARSNSVCHVLKI